MNKFDLSTLPTPQLKAIKQILVAGVPASAEVSDFAQDRSQLCHKSPPKGYPKDKSQYGDPACYRYPLNTKARCLAAWRYVHHGDNKSILGSKFKSIEGRIKRYAKEHYSLDLEVGKSEDDTNWEQAFLDYYDAETMGERCDIDCIVLEDESEASTREVESNMDEKEKIEALEKENQALKDEKETWATEKSELEEKASQVDTLTEELNNQKEELETLRQFKQDTEKAAERAERLKSIKSQLDEAEIEANLEDEAEATYWLDMSDDVLKRTIVKMGEIKKGSTASASKEIKVPQITNSDDDDPVATVREGLSEMKKDRK